MPSENTVACKAYLYCLFGFELAVNIILHAGTAVLQIGTALPYTRRLTACDGGIYTCVATGIDGVVITRNFTLQYGS